MTFKILELGQLGTYVVEVLKEDKRTSEVSIMGVLRYPAQGLSKDSNNFIEFINQKPLDFKDLKLVMNKNLHVSTIKSFAGYEIGTDDFYNETVRNSLIMAQYTIFNEVKNTEMLKKPYNWNHCKVVNLLTEHGKDFGFELEEVDS